MEAIKTSEKRVKDKLKYMSQADRLELLQKIRSNREERVKQFLGKYQREEQQIIEKKLMQREHTMIERMTTYVPTSKTSDLVRHKLENCFHFLFYSQSEGQEGEGPTCSICVKEFEQEEKVTLLSCKHLFHMHCIEKWFCNKIICPNCRSNPSEELNPVDRQLSALKEIKSSVMKREVAMQTRIEEILTFKSRSLYD